MADGSITSDFASRTPEMGPVLAMEDFDRVEINASLRKAMNSPGDLTPEDRFVLKALDHEVLGGEV